MNCNGDFSLLRDGKQKNQSSSHASLKPRSVIGSTGGPQPFHFARPHEPHELGGREALAGGGG